LADSARRGVDRSLEAFPRQGKPERCGMVVLEKVLLCAGLATLGVTLLRLVNSLARTLTELDFAWFAPPEEWAAYPGQPSA